MTVPIAPLYRRSAGQSCAKLVIYPPIREFFMTNRLKLEFQPFSATRKGVLIVFCDEGLKFGSAAREVLEPAGNLIERAAASERFKGKNGSTLDIVAPSGLDVPRLVVIGVGKPKDLTTDSWAKLGGIA